MVGSDCTRYLLSNLKRSVLLADSISLLGDLIYDQGRLDKAINMFKPSAHEYQKVFGEEHSTIEALNKSGYIYARRTPYVAVEWFQRALEGNQKVFGMDYISTLNIAYNLGNCYCYDGSKLDDAEKLFQRARHEHEKARGIEHLSTIEACKALGRLYEKQEGKLLMAKEMYQ